MSIMKKKIIQILDMFGFTWFIPMVRLVTGEEPEKQVREILFKIGLPVIAIVVFLLLWAGGATQIKTSLGQLPGPGETWVAAQGLLVEHDEERAREKTFNEQQDMRNQASLAQNSNAEIRMRKYTGRPTYIDQIFTSLWTVFVGFFIASLVAIPIGIICGSSPIFMTALNPLIQILKPVSPLAWLPIVTMVVSALYTSNDGVFEKSFIISAITVALCSLWATLLNTALGVASVDKDHMNVAKVLRLGVMTRTFKIVIPSSLPFIFTGLRISLGVGWMVLIAAEMLAQNPGLGKFVWDEFQNGSSQSLARIVVAVFTIGIIGFILDRIMVVLQKRVSFGKDLVSS